MTRSGPTCSCEEWAIKLRCSTSPFYGLAATFVCSVHGTVTLDGRPKADANRYSSGVVTYAVCPKCDVKVDAPAVRANDYRCLNCHYDFLERPVSSALSNKE